MASWYQTESTHDFEPYDIITILFLLKYVFIVNKGPYNLIEHIYESGILF